MPLKRAPEFSSLGHYVTGNAANPLNELLYKPQHSILLLYLHTKCSGNKVCREAEVSEIRSWEQWDLFWTRVKKENNWENSHAFWPNYLLTYHMEFQKSNIKILKTDLPRFSYFTHMKNQEPQRIGIQISIYKYM